MKRILKNRKGMTLIELLIGMLIFSIIMAAVSSVFAPTLRVYYSAIELAECNSLLNSLSAEILHDISRAEKKSDGSAGITASSTSILIHRKTGTIEYGTKVYGASGKLLLTRNGTPVLGEQFYKGKSLILSFRNPDADKSEISGAFPDSFYVRLTLQRADGTELVTRDYAAAPIGMQNT